MSIVPILFLPVLIIVIVVSLLRGQAAGYNTEQRRREIIANLTQQYGGQPRPQGSVPPHPAAYRPPVSAPARSQFPPVHANSYPDPDGVYLTYEEYTTAFKDAYYRAQDRGRDLDPWDLPPEKGPWER